jgi:hypothetical protein
MDKTLLVSLDLDTGAEILRILDEAGVKVNVALWAVLGEYGDWRLLLSSPRFAEADLRGSFRLVNRALDAAGFPIERKPSILPLAITDPLVKELRRIFRKARSVEGMRLGGQSIGDRWIEDGYVYRIS